MTTDDTTTAEGRAAALEPCPFCGATGPVMDREERAGYAGFPDDPDRFAYSLRCTSCAAHGGWAKSTPGAERWWNMRTAAARASGGAGGLDVERHEGRCDRCGGVNVVWWVDHDLWNATGRTDDADEWPFLCPSCFATMAEQRGVVPAGTVWKLVPSGDVAQRTEQEASTLPVAGSTPAIPITPPSRDAADNDIVGSSDTRADMMLSGHASARPTARGRSAFGGSSSMHEPLTTPCVETTWRRNHHGYGSAMRRRHSPRHVLAHPAGLGVGRRPFATLSAMLSAARPVEQRAAPDHLFLGTNAWRSSTTRPSELARAFGVCRTTIINAIAGRHWAHVPPHSAVTCRMCGTR